MIIESGFIVALGLLFTFWKCNWKMRMFVLSRPVMTDVVVFVLLNVLHWGTFSGVMVAACGALICSGMISMGRWIFGFTVNGKYFPGMVNVASKLA